MRQPRSRLYGRNWLISWPFQKSDRSFTWPFLHFALYESRLVQVGELIHFARPYQLHLSWPYVSHKWDINELEISHNPNGLGPDQYWMKIWELNIQKDPVVRLISKIRNNKRLFLVRFKLFHGPGTFFHHIMKKYFQTLLVFGTLSRWVKREPVSLTYDKHILIYGTVLTKKSF